MLTKKKADKLPDEFIDDGYPRFPSVERWLKDREVWSRHSRVYVQTRDFIVGEDNRLYVSKTAHTGTNSWVGGSVPLKRVHDGWLRADIDENTKFKRGDVTKNHLVVNILYKLVKLDDTIPLEWWNKDWE